MDTRLLQFAAIGVAFLAGRAGSPPVSAGSVQAGIGNQEPSTRTDGTLASRLSITKDKPGAEGCRSAEDIGKVRVYVGDFHYVVRLTHPTYPPSRKPIRPAESRPGLWFCAWDQTDPDNAAWYEVPGTLSDLATRHP